MIDLKNAAISSSRRKLNEASGAWVTSMTIKTAKTVAHWQWDHKGLQEMKPNSHKNQKMMTNQIRKLALKEGQMGIRTVKHLRKQSNRSMKRA